MSASRVVVFGVPTGAGGRRAAVADAPVRLRQAGLIEALRAAGPAVVDLGDLPVFPYRDDPAHPKARNAEGVAAAVRAVADQTARAVGDGFTLVLGGDCTIAAGVTAGAGRALREPVGLVFLDADADLNTPETTLSGFLHGMSLSLALGQGPAEVVAARGDVPPVEPDHAALVGYRALDPGERPRLGLLGLAVPAHAAHRLGMRAMAALALDSVENGDGPVVVHVDVDVIDPAEMTAKAGAPGPGLTFAEVSDLLAALAAAPRVVAIELCEYGPDLDPDLVVARKLVDLLARAVGRRFRREPAPAAAAPAPEATSAAETTRACRLLLRLVQELHLRGYQRLRIAPGMAPSGAYWRCAVAPVTSMLRSHGAVMAEGGGLAATYSSGMGAELFGWSDAAGKKPSELAEIFVERFPDVAAAGRGSDWAYAGWYVEMLHLTYPDALPYCYSDWPDTGSGFVPTLGPRKVRVPQPPPGEAEERGGSR